MITSGKTQEKAQKKKNTTMKRTKQPQGLPSDFLNVRPERDFRDHVTSFRLTNGQNRLRKGK